MKTKRKQPWMTLLVASFLLAALIGGCRKDDFVEIVGVCPVVISTNPANDAINIPRNQIVTATFNEEMNVATITQASFILTGELKSDVPVVGTLTYNNTNATLSFVPNELLAQNTQYTGTVKSSVKDLKGNALQTDYVWTFRTGSVGTGPLVISTDPLNNASGVALNKVVTATFNMAMDPATLTTATFKLQQGTTPVSGNVTYSGVTASFAPSGDLLPGTTYTATITTGAMSESGLPLASDYEWSFSTGTVVVTPIDLGAASIFGAFGGNAGITNQGINTVINGAIGTTAASTLVTGFHDGLTGDVYTETPLNIGLVTNGIYTAPPLPGTPTSEAIAILALSVANDVYNFISPASMPGGIDPGAGELGGLTLAPGIYKSASGTFNISNGDLTLDAQGDPNATWVFQSAAGLTVGTAGPTGARSVILANGALPKNVFWYVGSAATINGAGGGIMVGTIISSAGVTFSTPGNADQTVLNGRAISLVASVTMVNTTINVPAP